MDSSQVVITDPQGHCKQCRAPLPPKPASAKRQEFCRGSKCRSAWHLAERRKAFNEATAELDAVLAYITREGVQEPLLVAGIRAAQACLERARP